MLTEEILYTAQLLDRLNGLFIVLCSCSIIVFVVLCISGFTIKLSRWGLILTTIALLASSAGIILLPSSNEYLEQKIIPIVTSPEYNEDSVKEPTRSFYRGVLENYIKRKTGDHNGRR